MGQKTAVKTISVRETLTQDVVLANRLQLGSHPIAGFQNVFAAKGEAYRHRHAEEALVISDAGRLVHVRRDAESPTGWSDSVISEADWGRVSEVVVTAARRKEPASTTYSLTCFFIAGDAGSRRLYWSKLKDDGRTWTARGKCVTAEGADLVPADKMRVTSLQRQKRMEGDAVVVTDGTNLYCFSGEDAELDGEGKAKDLKAAFTPFTGVKGLTSDNLSDSIAALGEAASTSRRKNGVALLFRPATSTATAPAVYWMGMTASDVPKGVHPYEKGRVPVRALSAFSWADRHFFLLENKDGTFTVWSCDSRGGNGKHTDLPIRTGTKLQQVQLRLHGSDDRPQWDLYGIDSTNRVLLSRHILADPFNPADMPSWREAVYLVSDVQGLGVPSVFAGAQSAFFTINSAQELGLDTQDKPSGIWSDIEILLPDAIAREVTRYRIEAVALNAAGIPVPDTQLFLQTTPRSGSGDLLWEGPSHPDATGLNGWGDHAFHLTRRTPQSVVTDGTGRVVLTLSTQHGLAGPEFNLSCQNDDGTRASVTFQPGTSVHTYFLGGTTLHPTNPGGGRKPFTGDELKTLLKDNKDADTHAAAITAYARQGLGKTPEKDCAGTFYSVTGDTVQFQEFATREELTTFCGQMFQLPDISDATLSPDSEVEDVLLGLSRGIYTIVSATTEQQFIDAPVDRSVNLVHLNVEVTGSREPRSVNFLLSGLARAEHLIRGILQDAGAAAKDIVEWLRAVFNFSDIWKDKKSIEAGLTLFFGQTEAQLDQWKATADIWVRQSEGTVRRTKEEAEKAGKPYFGDLVEKIGKTTMKEVKTKAEERSTLASASTGTSHQWFTGKLRSTPGKMPAVATAQLTDPPKVLSKDFTTQIGSKGSTALSSLATFFGDSVLLPDKTLSDLLGTGKNLSVLLAEDAKQVFTYLFPYLKTAMKTAKTYLEEDLTKDWPLLAALWDWVAKAAGYPEDRTKFTVGGVLALAAAFPATMMLKAVDGHQATLFNGYDFQPGAQTRAGTQDEESFLSSISLTDLEKAAALLTALQAFPMAGVDAFTALKMEPPRWLTILSALPGGVIAALCIITALQKHSRFRWEHLGPIGVLAGCLVSLGGVYVDDPAFERVGPIWGTLCGAIVFIGTVAGIMTGEITGLDAQVGSVVGTFPPLATVLGVDALGLAGTMQARLGIDLLANAASGYLLWPK
ncbi:hypothetical protein [Streptomyces lavenduligriseus]|uniref:Uncharacterized protein n=1 Tax=Streptomyces lavenduligriseus TaxID=67315 RepID=A0ABT0P382_9ACTN|nr:hypothetical protein [Streptomyces lavenduligriseus]MCL3998194.1 hypothetical protein [Streptomyces lavenduligriseus]